MPPKIIGRSLSIGTIVFLVFLFSICLSLFLKKPSVKNLPVPPPPAPVIVCPPCECTCPEPFESPDTTPEPEPPQTELKDVEEALRIKANQRRRK